MLQRGWKAASRIFIALALVASAVVGTSSPTSASDTANWLPFSSSTVVEVGCTWNNGCDNDYHGSSAKAIDFIAAVGTPVYAAGAGNLVGHGGCNPTVSPGCNGWAGNYITIAHSGGRTSRYLHLASIAKANGSVQLGELIGYTGNSGTNVDDSDPHLHYDELDSSGNKVDPGPMNAVHGNTLVSYPSAIDVAYTTWNQVPSWSDKWTWSDGFAVIPPVAPPQRMMILDSNGVAYAKDTLTLDGWTQVTGFGGVSKIAVGGKRMVIQTSDGNIWGKDDLSLGVEGWQLLASFTNISAFAVGSTGRIVILNSLGMAYAKDSLGLDGWTQQTSFGGVQKIAVGGNRLMIQTAAGVYAKDDPMLSQGAGGWVQQTSFSGVSTIGVSSTGRMMILNTDGIAYAKDTLGLDGWTTLSGFGGITGMAVNGSRMAIRTTGGLYAKDALVTDGWWTQAGFPVTFMAVGNAGRMMMTTSAATYAKDGLGEGGWTQVTFFSGVTAIAVG